jgi:hypothetical protein
MNALFGASHWVYPWASTRSPRNRGKSRIKHRSGFHPCGLGGWKTSQYSQNSSALGMDRPLHRSRMKLMLPPLRWLSRLIELGRLRNGVVSPNNRRGRACQTVPKTAEPRRLSTMKIASPGKNRPLGGQSLIQRSFGAVQYVRIGLT